MMRMMTKRTMMAEMMSNPIRMKVTMKIATETFTSSFKTELSIPAMVQACQCCGACVFFALLRAHISIDLFRRFVDLNPYS